MLGRKKIDGNKRVSITNEVLEYLDMDKVYIPLANHTNLECKPTVIKGDKVLVGSIVGKRGDHFKLPIHSSVSGTVLNVEEMYHVSGEKVNCIVIKNDKVYDEKKSGEIDINKYSREDFVDTLRKCGVVGMGGSGFPTYVKYDGTTKLNKLIVNAVECEPYLTADYMVIKKYCNEIVEVLVALKHILKLEEIVIAIKKNNDLFEKLKECTKEYEYIRVVKVKNYYPAGWERDLVKRIYKVRYKNLPSEKGIVVNNINTIYSMYDVLKYEKAVVKRIITITGEKVNKTMNVIVRTGTLMNKVVGFCGGYNDKAAVSFIAGGPMTGKALDNDNLVMSKNLNSLLIKEVRDDISTVCTKCGKCSAICPVKLSPILLMGNDDIKEIKKLHPEKCMECGLCSYICPAKLDLRDQVKIAKDKIKQVKK